MSDEGTEADYMYECQMSELGAEWPNEAPTHEVMKGKTKNVRVFVGTRGECWGFKSLNGGLVQKFTG